MAGPIAASPRRGQQSMTHAEINRELVQMLVASGYPAQMANQMVREVRTGGYAPGTELSEDIRRIVSVRDLNALYNLVNPEDGIIVQGRQRQRVEHELGQVSFSGPRALPNATINTRLVSRLVEQGFSSRIANDVVVLARRELAGRPASDEQIPPLFGRQNYDLLVRTLRDSVDDRRAAVALISTLMIRPELRVSPTVTTETTEDRQTDMYFTDIYQIRIGDRTYAVEMPRTESGDRLLTPVMAGPEGGIRMRDQLSRRLGDIIQVWGPDRQSMNLEEFVRMYRRTYRQDPDQITNVSRVRDAQRTLYES